MEEMQDCLVVISSAVKKCASSMENCVTCNEKIQRTVRTYVIRLSIDLSIRLGLGHRLRPSPRPRAKPKPWPSLRPRARPMPWAMARARVRQA